MRRSRSTMHGEARRELPCVLLGAIAFVALVSLPGCDGAGEGHLISPDGSGTIQGTAFLDLDRNGSQGSSEAPLEGVRVGLFPQGSQDETAQATTDEEGGFVFQDVPAGSYRAEASGQVLSDSLEVAGVDPSPVQVNPNRTAGLAIAVSYPVRLPAQLASASEGVRVYVEGIALNQRGQLDENAVHVWDGERAIRAMNVGSFSMNVGDSVRILGRTELRAGRMVLGGDPAPVGFRVAERPEPVPVDLSTAEAAAAMGGTLDAGLVQIRDAIVSDVREAERTRVVQASDGSGTLHLRIPNAHLGSDIQPGARLSVRGLLLPRPGSAGWELRTRSGADLEVDAAGAIVGRTFHDADGGGVFESRDEPLSGVRLRIYRAQDATAPVATAESDGSGSFRLDDLEIGAYRVEVDPSTHPETLEVLRIDPEIVEVTTNETAQVAIAITHPLRTVAEARDMPRGLTLFVEGTALNETFALGDNSVHLRDGDHAIRVEEVAPPVVHAGNRVRMRAKTDSLAGQPILREAAPFFPGGSGSQAPIPVSVPESNSARNGDLDADLVQLRQVTVVSSSGSGASWSVIVRETGSSGTAEAVVRLASVDMTSDEAQAAFSAGKRLTLTGVLRPVGEEGPWRLHPRSGSDVVVHQ